MDKKKKSLARPKAVSRLLASSQGTATPNNQTLPAAAAEPDNFIDLTLETSSGDDADDTVDLTLVTSYWDEDAVPNPPAAACKSQCGGTRRDKRKHQEMGNEEGEEPGGDDWLDKIDSNLWKDVPGEDDEDEGHPSDGQRYSLRSRPALKDTREPRQAIWWSKPWRCPYCVTKWFRSEEEVEKHFVNKHCQNDADPIGSDLMDIDDGDEASGAKHGSGRGEPAMMDWLVESIERD